MRYAILSAIFLAVGALPAASAPIITISPSSIELSPTQTVLTFDVDPNGTPVSTLLFNLSCLASGAAIVDIQSAEPGVINVSGPALNGGEYQASFSAFFLSDRISSFSVGSVTLEGFVLGTPLVLVGEFTDPLFNTIPIGPTSVAIVSTPEPATASLLLLGLLALLALRRTRLPRS